ncbi:tyrosine-protein phosphatase [Candidatus Formimonas warabiya]|uniref:protein-tyrosine-phosphatase n=1 Tax=Formimonas warabiya TaxID=1761012 RepID=A0A3G1KUS5_FORW1|nr:CpsB/CapC family capsule biosynthesis tyrosine phosphatase [Candidatus Formimonas warabiya]ATW25945.1 hypothetical protein DCMF_15225 [Candidatus Formimonas warabiya]
MIDIHAHILACGDDGAATLDDTIRMAAAFSQTGVTIVAATPHFIRGSCEIGKEKIFNCIAELNDVLSAYHLDIKILPGMEVEICHEVPGLFKQGRLLTINDTGKYLLVELPFYSMPSFTRHVFYELRLMGVTPILAHPERNRQLGENEDLVAEMVQQGVLMQINGGSLLGYFGSKVRQTALSLVERNLAHMIGGDAHEPGGERGPCLHLVHPVVEKLVGKEGCQVLTQDNPLAVLEGRDVVRWEPKPLKTGVSRFFRKIFGS